MFRRRTVTVFLLLAILSIFGTFETAFSSKLTLSVLPSKPMYNVGETVIISGNLTKDDLPITDAVVALEVDDPKGDIFMLRTLETGPIDPNNWPLEILEVYSCDSNGNPKSSVQPGGNIGFKVRVRNNAVNPFDVRVMLSLVYSNKAPFKVFKVYNGSIGGELTMAWTQYPIPIPDGAVTGNTTVYANVYNSLPKNGGFALCPEKSASFSIGAGGPAPSPPSSSGQFAVEMAISRILVWLGDYTVYSRAMYSYEIAANITQFEIVLIGDLYEDGKIDMRDIAIVARAFGTFEGDPDWNPDADLTGTEYLVPDGRVDMRDIALVAKAFGSQALIDP